MRKKKGWTQMKRSTGWRFTGENGEFTLEQPQNTSYLYFPLVNEAGMMSAVTPGGHGGATSGHYTFLMPPVSVEDLHNSKASRNFWVHVEGKGVWSAAGNSAKQHAERMEAGADRVTMEAGFLWHRVTRENERMGLRAEITSFVPATQDKVELMRVSLTNISPESMSLTPTAAIPLYGRSADEQRDHRHVTSLLHRVFVSEYGIEVQPALSFDERGHRINAVTYSVMGAGVNGDAPTGFFPVMEDYIGEGGALDWPAAVVANAKPHAEAGVSIEGYEAIGALRFEGLTLQPGQTASYTVALSITDDRLDTKRFTSQYLSAGKFAELLELNKQEWESKLNKVQFRSGDSSFDQWMKWVTLQPILRRLMGNSFLPYHDYGRGGRGWRDLWQDCLALLFMEPAEVRELLLNNFAGVRIDGSNATIIGSKPGEFVADRNNIPRVWMDHGAWPFLTTLLYLHQSGDLDLLLDEQVYFKDAHIGRCKAKDEAWSPELGSRLQTKDGDTYSGTILEHLLLQNVVPFFLVGEHNTIKLEGADWNDGMDMAPKRGESVAFTAFYASNLMELAALIRAVGEKRSIASIEVAEEMAVLFDTLENPIDYGSIEEKHALLESYYQTCPHTVSGRKMRLEIDAVAGDLEQKAAWMVNHLREQEWIRSDEGYEWFNGYYNNDGEQVEGDHPNGVRMTLTGQVFAVMGGVATDEQVSRITAAVDRYLKDPQIGYRLNSNFGGIQQNLGRAFGFAFGHKENGAMFSHMSVMYANALYRRGLTEQGYAVLDSIYSLSSNYEQSRMYPGIPEYINERGRGMYTYLTGSASWLLLTLVTEVFGVKGSYGDLLLEPKLLSGQFDESGRASVVTLFADRLLCIEYRNPDQAGHGQYGVKAVYVNGEPTAFEPTGKGIGVCLQRKLIESLPEETNEIRVDLQLLAAECKES
jgi:cellobiose phosphorylase